MPSMKLASAKGATSKGATAKNATAQTAVYKSGPTNPIAPGYKLIDRYQFTQPYPTDLAGAEAWQAVDFALDRPVSVLLLSGPLAEAGAEAARRAALLSDNRLTKIIDVGSLELGGQTRYYIVTEPVTGPTLEELVSELPLDPATTRAIIGELAGALDEANQRGLHHVALRPSAVRVHNGRVMLTGLGIDAEMGAAHPELGDSEQQDATGLAALAYYALSGYWPLDSPSGDWRRADLPPLPLAPRTEAGAIVPLRELAPGSDPALLELADRAFGDSGASPAAASAAAASSGSANALRAPHAIARHLTPWAPLATDTGPVVPLYPASGPIGPHFGSHPATGATAVIPAVGNRPGRKSVLVPGAAHTNTTPWATRNILKLVVFRGLGIPKPGANRLAFCPMKSPCISGPPPNLTARLLGLCRWL